MGVLLHQTAAVDELARGDAFQSKLLLCHRNALERENIRECKSVSEGNYCKQASNTTHGDMQREETEDQIRRRNREPLSSSRDEVERKHLD